MAFNFDQQTLSAAEALYASLVCKILQRKRYTKNMSFCRDPLGK
jgi:hypothetical protein